MTPATAGDELRRNWPVLLAAAVGFGFGLGALPLYTNGVFIDPLSKAFGWSVSQLQLGVSLVPLWIVFLTPATGWMVDRFGARRIALTSLMLFGLSFMAMSLQNGSRLLYIVLWSLLAISGAGTIALVWSRVVAGWFSAGRGFALGLTLMGTGLVGMVSAPFSAWAIDHIGWRAAYVALGAPALCLALPLNWLFLRDRTPEAEQPRKQTKPDGRAAFLTWRFWVMSASLFFVSSAVSGLITNAVKLLEVSGFTHQQAANTLSLLGLFVILGRLCSGALMDRFWAPAVCGVFFILPGAAVLVMMTEHIGPWATALSVATVGLAAGAEFSVMPYLIAKYFGMRKFGVTAGIMSALFYLGQVITPIGFGYIYDETGSFHYALMISGIFFISSAALVSALGRYPAQIE